MSSSYIGEKNLSVMKWSVFIMLYNIIEYPIQNTFLTIFDYIHSNNIPYKKLSDKIRERWIFVEFLDCQDRLANFDTYTRKTWQMINIAVDHAQIRLTRRAMWSQWNLDKDTISWICNRFGIGLIIPTNAGDNFCIIRDKRNELSHWTSSFSEVWWACSWSTLRTYLEEIEEYMWYFFWEMNVYTSSMWFVKPI